MPARRPKRLERFSHPAGTRSKSDGSSGRKRRPVTFGRFADDLVAEITKGFKNEKHIWQWSQTLNDYAAPLRPKYVDEITTDDVLAVLRPL
jgi:hypothetical protein